MISFPLRCGAEARRLFIHNLLAGLKGNSVQLPRRKWITSNERVQSSCLALKAVKFDQTLRRLRVAVSPLPEVHVSTQLS